MYIQLNDDGTFGLGEGLIVEPRIECFNVAYIAPLLGWIEQGIDLPTENLIKHMIALYGFPISPMAGGKLEENGDYLYPRDPVLEPVASTETDHSIIYFYEYSMCAISDKETEEYSMYRFD